jgi:outer membrane biosynthesis protein TonB
MDTEKIVGDVAEVVRDLVSRTLTQAEERAEQIIDAAEKEAKSVIDRAQGEAAEIRKKAERDADSRLSAIQAALAEVQAKIGIRGEVPTSPVPAPEPEPPVVPEPAPPPPDPSPAPEPVPEPEPPLVPEPTPPPDEATPPQVAATAKPRANGKSNDDASARLVAMNLALEGATREQAKAQIEAEYDCADLDGLIDDIFARVPAPG